MVWQNGPTDTREIELDKHTINIGIKPTKNQSDHQRRAVEEGVLIASTITTARSRAERGIMQIVLVRNGIMRLRVAHNKSLATFLSS